MTTRLLRALAGRSAAVLVPIFLVGCAGGGAPGIPLSARCGLSAHLATREANPASKSFALVNGSWYEGGRFTRRTMYVDRATLRTTAPARVDSVIDLAGGYVIPPFAEGHNHFLEPGQIRGYIDRYLADGVFYVLDLTTAPTLRKQFQPALNSPESLDYVSSNQGWTGPGGHPLEVAEQLRAARIVPQDWSTREFAFVVESEADVARQWPEFMAGRPDLAKLYLAHSDEYLRRKDDPRFGSLRGMDPALVGAVARRAHDAGLCVAAHVNTAADFGAAVRGGVDIIAHLPGLGFDSTSKAAHYRITGEDARLAARRGVAVVTTLSWIRYESIDSTMVATLLDSVMRPNLATLRAAGVRLMIGSDQFRRTPRVEAELLDSLRLFTPAQIIESWSVVTPQAIYPARKLGRLQDGYEASFLVLPADPLADFSATGRITMRMKQGRVLTAAP